MKNVLIVGHCNFDHPRISSLIEDNFSAKTVRAKLMNETKQILEKDNFDLVVINRIGAFDQENGIELIKDLKKDSRFEVPLMLVTNYDDQMDMAIKNGGVPGFGKDKLFDNETIKVLGKYLS